MGTSALATDLGAAFADDCAAKGFVDEVMDWTLAACFAGIVDAGAVVAGVAFATTGASAGRFAMWSK